MASSVPPRVELGAPMPDPSRRYIPVVSPKPSAPLRMIVLGTSAIGCYVHWVPDLAKSGKGRTVPHTTPDDTCEVCVTRDQLPRWHAYLACWMDNPGRYVLADLTVYAIQTCPQLVPASGVVLRGRNLLLKRIGRNNNSPVAAELSDVTHPSDSLPVEFDVAAALARLWGVTNLRNSRLEDLKGRE